MNAKVPHMRTSAFPETDADIDQFLTDNLEHVAAKLAAGRDQVARGEATSLEPLDTLLRDARASQ